MPHELIPASNSIFSNIDEDKREHLIAIGSTKTYQMGEWIVHQGDNWPYLFLVVSGKISAIKESPEGRSLILETIGEGEFLWGLAFFLENGPMPAAYRAISESKLLLWSRDQLYPLLMKDGQLSWELSRLAIHRAQRASQIVDELAFQPVAGRLAKFLVHRFVNVDGDRVARDLTLDEMAAHVGSTREMVCRILQRFSNQGFIDITRTEFVFTDREGLSRLAQKVAE